MAEPKSTKIEREYVIPLREKCRPSPRYKKANKAIKSIKEFLVKHMQIRDRDLNKIKITEPVNEAIWIRGIKNPPHKIKVKAIKEGDIVRVEMATLGKRAEQKIARLTKREEKAVANSKESAPEVKPAGKEEAKKETKEEKVKEKEVKESNEEEAQETQKAAKKETPVVEKESAKAKKEIAN